MVPFFSVVIPTFNRSNKLRRCLRSVLIQSFNNYEVLVIDDGSTDDSSSIVSSFRDSRIRYYWFPNSGGPATPRNHGIDLASADWVCFLDSDDIWYSDKLLHVSYAISQHPNSDVFCNNEKLTVLATKSKSLLCYGPYARNFYRVMLLQGNRLSTSATTVRRSFLNQHLLRFNESPEYKIVEDYDMWLRIAFYGANFYFINLYLGEYVVEDDNISSNLPSLLHNKRILLRDHVYKIQRFQLDKDKLWLEINAGLLLTDSFACLKFKKYEPAVKYFYSAIKCSPFGSLRYSIMKLVYFACRAFLLYRLKRNLA